MAELMVIRHGQASFGSANYDQLSDLGHLQSKLVGDALQSMGWIPDRCVTGGLQRQKETLASMGFADAPDEHAGFNEYDFHNLLSVRFAGDVPTAVMQDRKTHFRTLRETVLDWQSGGLAGATETWRAFTHRVEQARRFATDTKAKRVLVISSGGVIGQLVARATEAPDAQMMSLNLQVKNTSITRFIFTPRAFFLHEFNSTPHFAAPERANLMTYS